MNSFFPTIIIIILSIFVIAMILKKPFLGIVFTLSSLPIIDLLPSIPLLSSSAMLIGFITLFVFIFGRKKSSKRLIKKFDAVHFIGLLFVCWVFISNPTAAWFGVNRNWLLTFIQLWVLMFLSGELLNSSRKHHILIWFFAIFSLLSAFSAIQQGYIGESLSTSIRAEGLAGQSNITARYFVIATVFFNYLRYETKVKWLRLITSFGTIITFIGVFFTLSRSGILLLFFAVGLQILFTSNKKNKLQSLIIFIIAFIFLWFSAGGIFQFIEAIIPSIQQGTDTVGLRFALWDAGIKMWLDNVVSGVGIGNFSNYLRFYNSGLSIYHRNLVAHNSYISILAETGFIGFVLFMLLISLTIKNFINDQNIIHPEQKSIRQLWLIVFIIILLSGLTKNDQYDKLFWSIMGISVYFTNKSKMNKQKFLPEKIDGNV